MKKTVIALAVLAASGASIAQVTISGNYTGGYQTDRLVGAPKIGGLGTDTAAVQFKASEDIGGGLKATAAVSIGGANRGKAVGGEDAFAAVEGGFGKIRIAAIEAVHFGTAFASAGAPGWYLDGKVFGANANQDTIDYYSPNINGVVFQVGYADQGGANAAPAQTGFGGTVGPTDDQPSWLFRATYSAGPLNARLDYTNYTHQGVGIGATPTTFASKDKRIRLSGNYDLGVVKLGAGVAKRDRGTATVDYDEKEVILGASAPIGLWTVGGTYGSFKDSRPTGAKRSGYSLGVQYDLSKRTNVSASVYSWKTDGISGNNVGNRVWLSHSF